jgi:hypothetical protein
VSKFDEQSHYVIENKGSEKRTKPNKANFPFRIREGDLACTFVDFGAMLIGKCEVQFSEGESVLCVPTPSSGALTERRTGAC